MNGTTVWSVRKNWPYCSLNNCFYSLYDYVRRKSMKNPFLFTLQVTQMVMFQYGMFLLPPVYLLVHMQNQFSSHCISLPLIKTVQMELGEFSLFWVTGDQVRKGMTFYSLIAGLAKIMLLPRNAYKVAEVRMRNEFLHFSGLKFVEKNSGKSLFTEEQKSKFEIL